MQTKINKGQIRLTLNELLELDRNFNGGNERSITLNSGEIFKVNIGSSEIIRYSSTEIRSSVYNVIETFGEALRIRNKDSNVSYDSLSFRGPAWIDGSTVRTAYIRSYNNNGLDLFVATTSGAANSGRIYIGGSGSGIRFYFSNINAFNPDTSSDWNEVMRITPEGKVGIRSIPKSYFDIGNKYISGYKVIGIDNNWRDALTVEFNSNFQSAYVRIYFGGVDWPWHSAAAYAAEFMLLNDWDAPGYIIRQISSILVDAIQARLVKIANSQKVKIQLRTVDVEGDGFNRGENYTLPQLLYYEVIGAEVVQVDGDPSGNAEYVRETPGFVVRRGSFGINTMYPLYDLDVNGSFRAHSADIGGLCKLANSSYTDFTGISYTTHNHGTDSLSGVGIYGNDNTLRILLPTQVNMQSPHPNSILFIRGDNNQSNRIFRDNDNGSISIVGGWSSTVNASIGVFGNNEPNFPGGINLVLGANPNATLRVYKADGNGGFNEMVKITSDGTIFTRNIRIFDDSYDGGSSGIGLAPAGSITALFNKDFYQDYLQFNPPNVARYKQNGVWYNIPVPRHIFAGGIDNGAFYIHFGWEEVELIWTNLPYLWLETFFMFYVTFYHSLTVKVQYSSDGTNWTTLFERQVNGWPATFSYKKYYTTSTRPYLKIVFTPVWNSSHPERDIWIVNIRYFGGYYPYGQIYLFRWDADRNVRFFNKVGINTESWPAYTLDVNGSFRVGSSSNFVDITDVGIRVYTNNITSSQEVDGVHICGGINSDPRIKLRKVNGSPRIDFSRSTDAEYHARLVLSSNNEFQFAGNVTWRVVSGDLQAGNYGRYVAYSSDEVDSSQAYPPPTISASGYGDLCEVRNPSRGTTGLWVWTQYNGWVLIAAY